MLKSIDGCLEPFDCLLVRLRTLKYLSWLSLIVLKKDKYLIISENVLLIQKKLVILHSVWNKYQKIKQKNVDCNVEDLSNNREKSSDWK